MSVRRRISLDGAWQFQVDPTGEHDVNAIQHWRTAQVPMPWQAQFEDLRHSSGVGWYRRTFLLPAAEAAPRLTMLHFGAVDYHATVWVNGQRVGENEGGYLPFAFDLSALVQEGENEVVVRVADPTDDQAQWPHYPFSEIPHGKQSWYGPISGIWQSVWVELRPQLYIERLRLTPLVAESAIEIAVRYNVNPLPATANLRLRLVDPTGTLVQEVLYPTDTEMRLTLNEVALQLWSPATPALYNVTASLLLDGQVIDEVRERCGFRTVAARAGRIYLNGEPLYLRGALDQAYYPETIYTPPSLEFLEDQVRKAKALGLNCLRCHIKVEDPRYYEVADRLGILIWTEIPNWVYLSPGASQRAKTTFLRMVERDWNHPSIFAWTLVNENWGTDLANNPEHRRWLAEFYHEAKKVDPYRLIVDNSACRGNFHVASDLDDYHEYRAIPDHAADWDRWVTDFANRAPWAWAADYAEERHAGLPLLVSEFGNWGLPYPDAIQEGGKDPWWFENGLEWGDGIVYPHAMRERFSYWGLDGVFGTLEAFTRAHQAHMARSLAYEISSMRLDPKVGGYVITEFTDVHWECNGLMDMQRNIKHGLDTYFTGLNQDRVVVARPLQWSGRPGETVAVEVRALGRDGAENVGLIRWQVDEVSGEIRAPGGTVQLTLTVPGIVVLHVTWQDEQGSPIAETLVELACVHVTPAAQPLCVVDNDALAITLAALGYHVLPTAAAQAVEGVVWVANHYTPQLRDALHNGAHLLLIAGTDFNAQAEGTYLPIGEIVNRAGTGWQGDWATSFSWLRKSSPFGALPGDGLLQMEYATIMPDAVITGIPAWAYRSRSWAGLALGWIHKPVSLLVHAPYGSGEIVATTFKLTPESLRTNVVAQALFAGCVTLL